MSIEIDSSEIIPRRIVMRTDFLGRDPNTRIRINPLPERSRAIRWFVSGRGMGMAKVSPRHGAIRPTLSALFNGIASAISCFPRVGRPHIDRLFGVTLDQRGFGLSSQVSRQTNPEHSFRLSSTIPFRVANRVVDSSGSGGSAPRFFLSRSPGLSLPFHSVAILAVRSQSLDESVDTREQCVRLYHRKTAVARAAIARIVP